MAIKAIFVGNNKHLDATIPEAAAALSPTGIRSAHPIAA